MASDHDYAPATLRWDTCEIPIMEAIEAGEDVDWEIGQDISVPWLAEQTGIPLKRVGRAVAELYDGNYLTALEMKTDGMGGRMHMNIHLSREGREAIGRWPRPGAMTADFLARAIERQLDATDDPGERSRL